MSKDNSAQDDGESKTAGFHDRLVSLIEEFDTLKDAGAVAGASGETVGRWKVGKSRVPFIAAAEMCAAQGQPLDWLAYGENFCHFKLNEQLLIALITGLEQGIADRKFTMSPRRKAQLVAIFYEYFEDNPAEMTNDTFISKVAGLGDSTDAINNTNV